MPFREAGPCGYISLIIWLGRKFPDAAFNRPFATDRAFSCKDYECDYLVNQWSSGLTRVDPGFKNSCACVLLSKPNCYRDHIKRWDTNYRYVPMSQTAR